MEKIQAIRDIIMLTIGLMAGAVLCYPLRYFGRWLDGLERNNGRGKDQHRKSFSVRVDVKGIFWILALIAGLLVINWLG